MGDERHLTPSTLYKEDVHEDGHAAVWGSFFDRETSTWGYSCCRTTQRGRPCTCEAKPTPAAESSASESEPSSEDSLPEWAQGPAKINWQGDKKRPTPEEFQPRSAFEAPEHFVGHFIRFVMGRWRSSVQGAGSSGGEQGVEHQDEMVRRMFRSQEALHQTEDALAPLVQRCEDEALIKEWRRRDKNTAIEVAKAAAQARGLKMRNSNTGRSDDPVPEMMLMERLECMVKHAHERDYATANKHYLELTLGKKKWHNAYHGGEGKSNKGFKLHTVSMSAPNSFDTDETVNNYIRAFRRVLLFCQMIRPNENVANHM